MLFELAMAVVVARDSPQHCFDPISEPQGIRVINCWVSVVVEEEEVKRSLDRPKFS